MGNDINRTCSTSAPVPDTGDIQKDKDELVAKLQALQLSEQSLRDEYNKYKEEAEVKLGEYNQLKALYDETKNQLDQMREEVQRKELKLHELASGSSRSLADRLKNAMAERGQTDALTELQQQLEDLDKALATSKSLNNDLDIKLANITKARDDLQAERDSLQAQLAEVQEKLQRHQAESEKSALELQTKLSLSDLGLDQARRRIQELEAQLLELEALPSRVASLEAQNEALKKQAGMVLSSALDLTPDVHRELAELYYVRIRIIGARDLPEPDAARIRRPYATLAILDKMKKTKVIEGSTRPDWNEEFTLFLEKKPKNFKIMIFDYDESRQDVFEQLGSVTESLSKYFGGDVNTFNGDLKLEATSNYPGAAPTVSLEYECKVVPQVVVRWMSGYHGHRNEHDKIARLLQYVGANVDDFDKAGRTPLMNAAIRDQPDAAEIFIRAGANVDLPDNAESKLTALMYAAIYGNIRVAECLVKNGHAFIEARDALKRSPLMLASQNGRVQVAELLLDHKAAIEATYQGGSTSLMLAAAEGHTPMVQCLIDHKAQLEAKNTMGMTALALTAMRDIADVTKCLVEAKANTETRDNNGLTPLMIAALRGQTNVMTILLNGGADVEAQDPNGRTALMYAAFQGQLEVIKLLVVKANAKLNVYDHNDQTATMIAAQSKRTAAEKLLKELEKDKK